MPAAISVAWTVTVALLRTNPPPILAWTVATIVFLEKAPAAARPMPAPDPDPDADRADDGQRVDCAPVWPAVTDNGPIGAGTVPISELSISASVSAWWADPLIVAGPISLIASDAPIAIPAPTPESPPTAIETAPVVAVDPLLESVAVTADR